jgi:hypothetical protein
MVQQFLLKPKTTVIQCSNYTPGHLFQRNKNLCSVKNCIPGDYHSAIKRNRLLIQARSWMDLKELC